LEKILRLFGCKVTTAADGRAGFEAICLERPEAAMVDIGLPGIDGYGVARRVRSTLPGRFIRLIAAAGYGRGEDRVAAIKAGFDAHVVKPMNPEELIRLWRE
jgi:CheY-like chemotaxis protein